MLRSGDRFSPWRAIRAAVPLLFVAGLVYPHAARSENYVIQPGDTLSGISDRFGVAVTELVRLNDIKDIDRILPGSSLRVGSGSSSGAGTTTDYRVRPGDTLGEVAERHGVGVRALIEANGLDDEDVIIAGSTLRIPRAGSGVAPTSSNGGTRASQQHRVQSGESVSAIAERYGVSTSAVVQANGLADAHLIRPGDVLLIPARTLGTPSAHIGTALDRAAAEFGVDPYLLRALSLMESGWQNDVVSHAGAIGLMQLMPETARWALDVLVPGANNWRVSAVDNARIGAAVLKHLLVLSDGNVGRALAAYYQGWTSIHRDGIFEETKQYVEDVLALRQRLRS